MPSRLLAAVVALVGWSLVVEVCLAQEAVVDGAGQGAPWFDVLSVQGRESLWNEDTYPGTGNVFFDDVTVREGFEPTSVEVMKQHLLQSSQGANTWRTGWQTQVGFSDWSLLAGQQARGTLPLAEETIESVGWRPLRAVAERVRLSSYATTGLRYDNFDDSFFFEGVGSILGRTTVETRIEHELLGPQVGLGVVAETSMLRFEATILGLIGYGNAEASQWSILGEEAIPGALNRSAAASRTTTHNNYSFGDYVAWNGELRLTASCQLTQSLRVDAGWTGVSVGPVYSAGAATAWNVPAFGINDVEGRAVEYDYWTFGLTYTR